MNKLVTPILVVAITAGIFSCKKSNNSTSPQFRIAHVRDSTYEALDGNVTINNYWMSYTDGERLATIKSGTTQVYSYSYSYDTTIRTFNFGVNGNSIDVFFLTTGTTMHDTVVYTSNGLLSQVSGGDSYFYTYNSAFQMQFAEGPTGNCLIYGMAMAISACCFPIAWIRRQCLIIPTSPTHSEIILLQTIFTASACCR